MSTSVSVPFGTTSRDFASPPGSVSPTATPNAVVTPGSVTTLGGPGWSVPLTRTMGAWGLL